MIKSVTVINHLGESLKMELMNPEKSGFAIKSISGLGPSKADIHMTDFATVDGAIDNSARIESRDITLDLIFYANPTIEDTRLLSYKYFPSKQMVNLIFETDNRTAYTQGRVESNEPSIFSTNKKDHVGCKISILCPDSFMYSIGGDRHIFNGIEPLFEFPFTNEVETKTLQMGSISQYTERNVSYEGDAETGVIIVLHALGTIRDFAIYNTTTREVIKIDDDKYTAILGSGISASDEITINTSVGKKSITALRGGVTYNILNVLDKDPDWFQLSKGDNVFVYTVSYGLENVQLTIKNEIAYYGV